MGKEHSPSSQLGLGELRDRVVGSGGEGDHTAVGGGDGEGDVGGRGVPIKGSQLLWSGTLNGRNEKNARGVVLVTNGSNPSCHKGTV